MWDVEINWGLRPCIVNQNGEEKKVLFHTWECFAKPVVFGLVEYEDGTMGEVNPSQIRFVDKKIKDYAFSEEGGAK